METAEYLDASEVEVRRQDGEQETELSDRQVGKRRCQLVLEPVVFLFILSLTVQSATLPLYLYYRIGKVYNVSEGGDRAYVCDTSADPNSTEAKLTELVQSEASMWTVYKVAISYGAALIVIPIYSSASDFFGRKLALAIPCIGSLIDACVCLLVTIFDLPLWLLVTAGGFTGLGGGFGALFAGVFAYLADVTDKKKRPVRTAILQSVYAITSNLSQLGTGWLIRLTGYTVPLVISALSVALCLAFVLLMVKEVRSKRVEVTGCASLLLPMKGIGDLFRVRWQLTLSLALLLPAFGLYGAVFMGSMGVSALYQMNIPFCMDSVSIGYLETVRTVAFQIGVLIGASVFEKRLGTVLLCGVSMVSSVAYFIVTAFASTVAWLYVACAAGILAMIPVALFRSHLSQLVPANIQGALFSCVGVLDVGGALVGSLVLTLLYNATLSQMAGLAFLVAAGGSVVAMAFTFTCAFTERLWPPLVAEELGDNGEEKNEG